MINTNISLPLNNKKIVITRSQDQILKVKTLFQNCGAKVYEFPTLIIDYPENLKPLDDALSEMEKFDWIVFSSVNGIKFLEKRLIKEGLTLKKFRDKTKIAVVGEKTAQYLISLGIEPDFIPPNFVADSLIAYFPMPVSGKYILLPRVQTGGRNVISEFLINEGALVKDVPTYESKCPDFIPKQTINAFQEKIIDAILFSSGKTVQNASFLLKKNFGKNFKLILDNIKIISIGPQTSIACQKYFGRVDRQADIYTFDGLLDATKKVLN